MRANSKRSASTEAGAGKGGRPGASLHQEITDRIIAELERGTVPWVKPCGRAKAGLGLPRNASSGRQPPLLQQKNSSCRSRLNKASCRRRGRPCSPYAGA
ncbi:ArdC family protein [Mesorhizobium sp. M0598]